MRRLTYVAVAPIVLVAGCMGSSAASTPSATQPSHVPAAHASSHATATSFHNWPTYGRTMGRTGHTVHAVPGTLRHSWQRKLDGAVYGEPLVVGTTLIVATENDTVYGLNASNGKRRWRTHLGTPAPLSSLPCGDIDPLGITGTPAYDSKTGSVFTVAETTGGRHTLWALNAKTGHRRWHKPMDVVKNRQRDAEQERSAVLVTSGRVITTYGGLDGDCANYVGYVTSTPTNGKGKTRHYAVPTSREAGMWSPAGPVAGQNGNVYVASGNGAETQGKWDKSDSVTELTPKSLHLVGVFAPSTWPQDNIQDLDLGSSSPVPVDHRLVIAGKRGTVYLLKPSLGGVGSNLTSLAGCHAFGGAAVTGHTVLMPCKGENAIRALRVGRHSLKWSWTASKVYSTPVIAGKRVYAADPGSGDLVVLRLSDGKVLRRLSVGSLPHFPSETVDGGRVFVGTLSGVTSFKGS